MSKERESNQKKLAKRKYKIPNRFIYFLYHFIFYHFIMPKYKHHITVIDDINECKGPCFLIWNHLSRLDHGYLMAAAYPRRISILAGYSEFFRSHLHLVFKLNRILPKKNFAFDPNGIKAINSIIKQGGCVCFSPEGMSSVYGTNQPAVAGSGHFIRHYRVPVYFMKMRGQYLTSTKICTDERYGRTEAELSLLFTPEQLENMTDEEVEAKINEVFRGDDYEWGYENGIHWKHKGDLSDNLDQVCYKCPVCGAEFNMKVGNNSIVCEKCGSGASINDMYEFVPFNKEDNYPKFPSHWALKERADIIKEIRADRNYSFTEKVSLGYIPEYKLITKMRTSVICGEGTMTIDHKGVHFKGTKLGEKFEFDMSYKELFTLTIMTDCTRFAIYVNTEFYEFYPERHTVGKMLMLTEEMHRLHVNTWKNFPWNDYLYENAPEYIEDNPEYMSDNAEK